jgi:alpha-1,3-glucosyltransferase
VYSLTHILTYTLSCTLLALTDSLFVHYFLINQPLKAISLFLILLQPSLLLIDHGHFQYNCVSLGLALWAIVFLLRDQDLLASIFFCLSLNYKQMSFYYAPSFFFYLLGKNLFSSSLSSPSSSPSFFLRILSILKLGFVVLFVFFILWVPFCLDTQGETEGLDCVTGLRNVISRMFPLNRGLFEDKVSNFWCTVSPFLKVKQSMSHSALFTLT